MKRVVLMLLCVLAIADVEAQDTLSVSLSKVHQDFLANNLDLIAQRYSMDAAEAIVKQSRLYANPSLTVGRELYSGEKKKFFDRGSDAEYSLQLQQLFSIAGRRHNQIEMAKIGYSISQLSYQDLMRNLNYHLTNSFYQLYFQQQSLALFTDEQRSIGRIVSAYQEQKTRGNIAQKELLRMVALQESLEHQRLDVESQILALQHDMNTLLHTCNRYYRPTLDESWEQKAVAASIPSIASLIDSASTNRSDVRMALQNLSLAQQNIKLQRSMAIPDIALGGQFDRVGGPSRRYVGVTATFDLPLFNRNQGSISAAKASVRAAQAQSDAQVNRAAEDVVSSYHMLLLYHKAIQHADPSFITSYKELIDAAQKQYLQRNMSLLEFLDLYDSYKENCLEWNDKWMKYLMAKEELNYQVGAAIVK